MKIAKRIINLRLEFKVLKSYLDRYKLPNMTVPLLIEKMKVMK